MPETISELRSKETIHCMVRPKEKCVKNWSFDRDRVVSRTDINKLSYKVYCIHLIFAFLKMLFFRTPYKTNNLLNSENSIRAEHC